MQSQKLILLAVGTDLSATGAFPISRLFCEKPLSALVDLLQVNSGIRGRRASRSPKLYLVLNSKGKNAHQQL